MTKINLRLKYKQETGESPSIQQNINYTHDGGKMKLAQWFTNEYSEWLEEKLIISQKLNKIYSDHLKLKNK